MQDRRFLFSDKIETQEVTCFSDEIERKEIVEAIHSSFGFPNCCGIVNGTLFALELEPTVYEETYRKERRLLMLFTHYSLVIIQKNFRSKPLLSCTKLRASPFPFVIVGEEWLASPTECFESSHMALGHPSSKDFPTFQPAWILVIAPFITNNLLF